ncbi:Uncharacterized protein TCM_036989 [Theobroma cacao]|uniref:Uncharacterized protein n=1 Tax=Theobroma cacao TaxID=3641 RepID=A0A061GJ65_THECC|nr:Uncharacterized protein TCM_036989 [Theobroma cacao]
MLTRNKEILWTQTKERIFHVTVELKGIGIQCYHSPRMTAHLLSRQNLRSCSSRRVCSRENQALPSRKTQNSNVTSIYQQGLKVLFISTASLVHIAASKSTQQTRAHRFHSLFIYL